MLRNYLLYTLLCIAPCDLIQSKAPIKAICFDIETILETDDMRASGYVGKLDSLFYMKKVGHLPCQKDLFENLAKVPAQSNLLTYNNNLKMPFIFSDWLLNQQSATTCLNKTLTYLTTSSLSDIEVKVLGNIVRMMMTPSSLIDIQKIIPTTEKLIAQLKQKGYKLYLTGNWANLESLQKDYGRLLQNFSGVFLSGKMHQLKPYQDYYDTVLNQIAIDPSQVLWLEKELNFVTQMKKYGFSVIQYNPKDKKTIYKDLDHYGIALLN